MSTNIPEACCTLDIDGEKQEKLVAMFKALGNPTRLEMMKFLVTHPGCITGDIVSFLPIAQATVSQHLKVLRDAGFYRRNCNRCCNQLLPARREISNGSDPKLLIFFRPIFLLIYIRIFTIKGECYVRSNYSNPGLCCREFYSHLALFAGDHPNRGCGEYVWGIEAY